MEKVYYAGIKNYTPQALHEALQKTLLPVAETRGGISGKKVMIKPNLLEYRKVDDPASVNPQMLLALCTLLRENNAAEIAIIENPAVRTAPAIITAMGIGDALQQLGVKVANCSRYEKIAMPETTLFHQLEIATEFRDYDLVIDFAKAKTHAMMTLTLAVKNLFGVIRGSERLGWHLAVGMDYSKFADLLLDIHQLVKPHIALLDAVVGMEGNGPGSGTPIPLNFIAASANALTLDNSVAERLSSPDIPVLQRAEARNMLIPYENCGEIPEKISIRLPEPPRPALAWGVYFPVKLREWLRKKMISRPVVDKRSCIGCGLCVQKCPPQSLILKNGKPVFRYRDCIRCYCCQEYCPQGAITTGDTLLMQAAASLEKILRRGKKSQ